MPNNGDRKAHGREGLAVREGRLTRRREPDSFDPDDYFVPSGEGGRAGGPSRANAIVAIVLIVLALISSFPVRIHFSSPDAFEHTIEKLDDKRNTVLGLTTAATGASVALTAIPDDVGTPVAEKLMDLSGDLLVVLTAIYLEKYLLTVFSVLSFGFLIPLALAALAAYALFQHRVPLLHALPRLATKVLLMGVLLVATVPTSVAITDMIDHTYDISVSLDSQAEGGQESGAGDAAGDAAEDSTPRLPAALPPVATPPPAMIPPAPKQKITAPGSSRAGSSSPASRRRLRTVHPRSPMSCSPSLVTWSMASRS